MLLLFHMFLNKKKIKKKKKENQPAGQLDQPVSGHRNSNYSAPSG